VGCSIPHLSSLQAVVWWSRKWGLALHPVPLNTSLCCGRCPSFSQGLLSCAGMTDHPWLSFCDKYPSGDSSTPGLSLLTVLPMQYCLFLPLSAGAAGPPELLALFTHCQCFLLRKYAPIRLCS